MAADLFRRVASPQPITDYHCHLSPRDIAEDRQFEHLHAVWLDGLVTVLFCTNARDLFGFRG